MAEKNPRTGLSIEEMMTLMKAVSESNIDTFEYKEGDFSIALHSAKNGSPSTAVNAAGVSFEQQAEAQGDGPEEEGDDMVIIKSPLVGTFYDAPASESKPFVKIGDHVKKGQVLAIVEAMKMMNEIESVCDGTVSEILVTNGSPVEYGQPLFKIS